MGAAKIKRVEVETGTETVAEIANPQNLPGNSRRRVKAVRAQSRRRSLDIVGDHQPKLDLTFNRHNFESN